MRLQFPTRVPRALLITAIAVILLVAPRGTLTWGFLVLSWPFVGLGIWATLCAPPRLRPVVIGTIAFAAGLGVALSGSPLAGGWVGFTTIFQFTAGSFLIRRYVGFDALLGVNRGPARFMTIVFCLGAINAVTATLNATLVGVAEPLVVGLVLAVTHVLGISLLVPFAFALPSGKAASRVETLAQLVATLLVLGSLVLEMGLPIQTVLIFPLMLWLTLRNTLARALQMLGLLSAGWLALTGLRVGGMVRMGEVLNAPQTHVLLLVASISLCAVLVALPLALNLEWQRREAQMARLRERRLEQIIDSARGVAIFTVTVHGTVSLFSPGAERLIGYSQAEAIGRSAEEFLVEGEIDRLLKRVGLARPEDLIDYIIQTRGLTSELRVRRKDGQVVTFLVTTTPTFTQDGELLELLTTGDDITERVETERALRQALTAETAAAEHLGAADDLKHKLVTTISHELRTPTASVIGNAEILLEEGASLTGPQREQMLRSIARNGDRLSTLIDSLLVSADVVRQGLTSPTTVDVGFLLQEACDNVAGSPGARRVKVDTTIEDSTGSIVGEDELLFRLFSNLLTNAMKFSLDGGEVQVSSHGDDEWVTICVRDQGIGIPTEEQATLFDQFTRARAADNLHIPGTGLGLFICREVARLHGGDIAVESGENEGACFRVTLARSSRHMLQRD